MESRNHLQRNVIGMLITAAFVLMLSTAADSWAGRGGYGDRRRSQADNQDTTEALARLDELAGKVKAGETVKTEDIQQAASSLTGAAWSLEPGPLLEKLQILQKMVGGDVYPTAKNRIRSENALARLIVILETRQMTDAQPEQVKAHPAADAFPGKVSADADRVGRKAVVDTNAPGWHNYGIYGNPRSPYWHSTGLYAAPGEVITVKTPEQFIDKGLSVRIGAHSDRLWRNNSWSRFPDICRKFDIESTTTKAANAFGGLIYIEAPHELKIGEVPVRISGAVRAPHFILGRTKLKRWRQSISKYAAPWAELEGRKVILTLPSEVVRDLEDPESLMEFWDGIMDRYADLLGRDRQRRRVERFVPDIQISAGYMHSGYPLMTMLDITKTMVDKDRIIANGHHGVWGLFHEIGHNHQNSDWTFRGTTEVTVNLFSLYIMEYVCSLPSAGHGSITAQAREKNTVRYLSEGADFEKWKTSPFLALIMYMQLKESFGWEPFSKVFAEYRAITQDDRPKSDDARRDQWMVRFSRATGKDLGPFFQAWGVPTSEQARTSIADLPEWMPEGFPPKNIEAK